MKMKTRVFFFAYKPDLTNSMKRLENFMHKSQPQLSKMLPMRTYAQKFCEDVRNIVCGCYEINFV